MNNIMENGIKCSVCIRGDPIIKDAIIINKNSTLLWLMAIIPETDASVIKILKKSPFFSTKTYCNSEKIKQNEEIPTFRFHIVIFCV